jgi:parallel beta-helix repeat protein
MSPQLEELMRYRSSHSGISLGFILLFALLAPLLMAPGCGPELILVHGGESIQDAVDAAAPGSTIMVLPGVYTGTAGNDSVVDVQTSGLTITGSKNAVIDATGFEYGIMVGPDVPITAAGCPAIAVTGFHLNGLTIQNADDSAVRLVGVDGFSMNGTRYLDNFEYGPFPVCSKNGEIRDNYASGSNDAAIYVGDDENVDVFDNYVTDSVAGIEIENTFNSVVSGNVLTGNTGGILAFVLPGLPQPFTENVLIEDNEIFDNNRTNTGSGSVGTLPEGTGILIIGADNVTVRNNEVTGNDSFGIGIIGNPFSFFDPRIEPFVDGLLVENNTFLDNGANPDPLRTFTPGADIIFLPDVFDTSNGMLLLEDPDPSDNCFANNTFDVDFPPGIVDMFPCP